MTLKIGDIVIVKPNTRWVGRDWGGTCAIVVAYTPDNVAKFNFISSPHVGWPQDWFVLDNFEDLEVVAHV